MLAPGQPFPLEGVPSGDVNPGTNTNAANSQLSPTQSSAADPSHTPNASSHKLSTGAIVGIVIGGLVVAVLIGALFFLLGRQKTMLQFMRRNHYQAPGAQIPPGDQPDIRSPPPQMSSFPSTSAIPYSETPNYHEPAYDTPPYTRHAAQDPLAAPQPPVAELPSPGEKHMQEYISSKSYGDGTTPTGVLPGQQSANTSTAGTATELLGAIEIAKTLYVTNVLETQQLLIFSRTSELSAESPTMGRSPKMSSSRYQANR